MDFCKHVTVFLSLKFTTFTFSTIEICVLFQEKNFYKFETVGKVMRDLLEWRRQLVSGTLTHDQTRELTLKIIQKIDWGNR